MPAGAPDSAYTHARLRAHIHVHVPPRSGARHILSPILHAPHTADSDVRAALFLIGILIAHAALAAMAATSNQTDAVHNIACSADAAGHADVHGQSGVGAEVLVCPARKAPGVGRRGKGTGGRRVCLGGCPVEITPVGSGCGYLLYDL